MFLPLLKFFFNSKPLDKKDINFSEVENILIVRQHNQLGDMLCSVPLFEALRDKFPKSHITLVASPTNYDILFSDINPFIDDVIKYDKTSLGTILRFYKALREKKYQVGIVPSTVSLSRTSHMINRFSGAKIRVGVKSIDGKFNKMEFLLNIKSDFKWDENKLHQIERNLQIGEQIGCSLSAEKAKINIVLSKDELVFGERYIEDNFPEKDKPVIAFHPGAGKIPNRWSVDNFTGLIKSLYEKYHNHILITSGNIDTEITGEVSANLDKHAIPHKILSDTPIRKVGAVLKNCDIYVTNDTGTMHVGGGVGTNVVSLFGPTHGFEWAPRGENNIYIQSSSGNINDITVDEVLDACNNIINKLNLKPKSTTPD